MSAAAFATLRESKIVNNTFLMAGRVSMAAHTVRATPSWRRWWQSVGAMNRLLARRFDPERGKGCPQPTQPVLTLPLRCFPQHREGRASLCALNPSQRLGVPIPIAKRHLRRLDAEKGPSI